jgi:hypothetical protein
MRAVLALLGVLGLLTGVAGPAAAAATDKPDAQMLLDLDLLRETDPHAQPVPAVVGHLRLFEFLRRLESASATTPRSETAPAPKPAC